MGALRADRGPAPAGPVVCHASPPTVGALPLPVCARLLTGTPPRLPQAPRPTMHVRPDREIDEILRSPLC